MSKRINISGIDKMGLLKALWDGAKQDAALGSQPIEFDVLEAEFAVREQIDTFCGRFIGADISGMLANPTAYDSRWGNGAFARAVQKFKW